VPIKLIPIDPPEGIERDDPLGLLAAESSEGNELAEARLVNRAGKALATIIGSFEWDPRLHPRDRFGRFIETPDAPPRAVTQPTPAPEVAMTPDPEPLEQSIRPPRATSAFEMLTPTAEMEMLTPAGGWTATPIDEHPLYPANYPDSSRAGKPIRVGELFEMDGRPWEVTHIAVGHLIVDEASAKKSKVETRIIKPSDMPGKGNEIGGITPLKEKKKLIGGKSKSTVRIVDPYVDSDSHDPNLQLPSNSPLTPEEWQAFGLAEQLHYIDLMTRYGEWKSKAPIKSIWNNVLSEYDAEVVAAVKNAHFKQYSSSSGNSLSLVGYTESDSEWEIRSRAMELQGRLRDIIAWDLYNRTRSPDLAVFHGSASGMSWWQKLISSKGFVFSGMSQSFDIQPTHNFGYTKLATPMSIRHIVMATTVVNWLGKFASEREIAIVPQFLTDMKRSMLFEWNSLGTMPKKWLENMTTVPRPGNLLKTLRSHFDNGEDLPVTVPPGIQIAKQDLQPPPLDALEIMQEYADELPEILNSPHSPESLSGAIPWSNVDDKGNPIAQIASDAGVKPGDFMIGLKGTLYWIGPDPNSGFGLRYHKIVTGSDGKLAFNGESYDFEGGGSKPYFFLKGNVPPIKTDSVTGFDPAAWQQAAEDPTAVKKMAVGEKFKVNGTAYEMKGVHNTEKVLITDLESGLSGTMNGDFKAVRLVQADDYVAEGAKLKPAKGMTVTYKGKKAVVTSVKGIGLVSIKPQGEKVVQLEADDPVFDNLFDPSARVIGDKVKSKTLKVGDYFHGGTGVKTIKPYKVELIEGNKIHWLNLDTGEKGTMTGNKAVRKLEPANGPDPSEPPPTPEPTTEPDTETPGLVPPVSPASFQVNTPKNVTTNQLKPGDKVSVENLEDGQMVEKTISLLGDFNWSGFSNGGKEITFDDGTSLTADNEASWEVWASEAPGEEVPAPGSVEDVFGPNPTQQQPAVEIPAADIDALPEVQGFDPYSSPYGSGAKYKHDRIAEMPAGTVFKDKSGKLFKVQVSGAKPVITDGQTNMTIDGKLRGRALPGSSLDGPPPPVTDNPYPSDVDPLPDVGADASYTENTGGLKLSDLKVGTASIVEIGEGVGQVAVVVNSEMKLGGLTVKSIETGEQWALSGNKVPVYVSTNTEAPAAATTGKVLTGNLIDSMMGSVPSQDVLSKDSVDIGQLILMGKDATSGDGVYAKVTGLQKSLLGVDHLFFNNEGAWKVDPEGNTTPLDLKDNMENWVPEKASGAFGQVAPPAQPDPDPPAPSELYAQPGIVGNLEAGDQFVGGDGKTYEVIAPGANSVWVKDALTMEDVLPLQVDPETSTAGFIPPVPAPDPEPVDTVGVVLPSNITIDDLNNAGPIQVNFYKSAYGTGAKYKHDRLEELQPGDSFTTSGSKIGWKLVKLENGGTALIYSPETGEIGRVDAKGRVRKV
jgi:hypothetical protein